MDVEDCVTRSILPGAQGQERSKDQTRTGSDADRTPGIPDDEAFGFHHGVFEFTGGLLGHFSHPGFHITEGHFLNRSPEVS